MSSIRQAQNSLQVAVYNGNQRILEKIFDQTPLGFGRSPKMEIPLTDFEFVSRAHGMLSEEGGQWYLIDLKSSNGIIVDGKRIEKIKIEGSVSFQIGRIRFDVEVKVSEKTRDPDNEDTAPTIVVEDIVAAAVAGGASATFKVPESIASVSKEEPKFAESVHLNQPQKNREPALPKPIPPHVPTVPVSPSLPPLSNAGRATGQKLNVNVEVVRQLKDQPFVHKAVLDNDFSPQLLGPHPTVLQTRGKKLEAVVTWHGVFYDIREFYSEQTITIGPLGRASLNVPILKDTWALAKVGFERAQCYVPQGRQITMERENQSMALGDLIAHKVVTQTDFGYSLKMEARDVTHIDLGSGMEVHLRYIPSSPSLTNAKVMEPEEAVKQALISSAVLHATFLFIMYLAAPPSYDGPKLKNIPERYARLLMEKPKPKPTPPPVPEKKPEPKKEIVKKPIPEKKIVKLTPKKLPKVIQKANKFPMVVKQPIKAPPPVKVETLGALAALGPLSSNPAQNVITNININKDAGGLPSKAINTGGIIGALPSSNGKLVAGGMGQVKTKGFGFGTGTGYGIQGLKGTAGGRGVAGAVVGEPKLAQTGKTDGLTRAQVMGIIQKYLGEIQHCYERILLADPGLAGRMEFEWDISPGGNVDGVRVKRSTVNNGDALGECVKGIFAQMKFPRAKNGQTTTPTIGFPFGRL